MIFLAGGFNEKKIEQVNASAGALLNKVQLTKKKKCKQKL